MVSGESLFSHDNIENNIPPQVDKCSKKIVTLHCADVFQQRFNRKRLLLCKKKTIFALAYNIIETWQ